MEHDCVLNLWGYDSQDKVAAVLSGRDTLLRDTMGELKVTTVTHVGDPGGARLCVESLGMR